MLCFPASSQCYLNTKPKVCLCQGCIFAIACTPHPEQRGTSCNMRTSNAKSKQSVNEGWEGKRLPVFKSPLNVLKWTSLSTSLGTLWGHVYIRHFLGNLSHFNSTSVASLVEQWEHWCRQDVAVALLWVTELVSHVWNVFIYCCTACNMGPMMLSAVQTYSKGHSLPHRAYNLKKPRCNRQVSYTMEGMRKKMRVIVIGTHNFRGSYVHNWQV